MCELRGFAVDRGSEIGQKNSSFPKKGFLISNSVTTLPSPIRSGAVPMKAVRGRCVLLFCLSPALFAVGSGCTVGGKSFSMDSNSRVPFFGLELRERKPKSTAPTYNSISRSNTDGSRVEPALRVGSSTASTLLTRGDRQIAIVADTSDAAPPAATIPVQPVKLPTAQAIPFPEIGERQKMTDRRSASTTIDFQ